MARIYINETEGAKTAISEIVELVQSGKVLPLIGFDVETAPLPGLVGYPGSQTDDEGNVIKAQKKTYLEFAQKVWRENFNPSKLQALGLYLPKKTTSGKEGDVTAQEAWQLFLNRIYELESTVEGRAQLEAARWTEQDLARASMNIWSRIEGIDDEEIELRNQIATAKKGVKKLEGQLKKLLALRDELRAEAEFLDTNAYAMLKTPLDLRLCTHVVKVGVEGRIHLDPKRGTNRLDPVQPGLDPYTSTVFLVQFTLVAKETKELLSYIINTHKVGIKVIAPILRLKKVVFVGANIKFDLKMAMHHVGVAPQKTHCTRVASRMLYLGLKMDHSLAAVAKRFIKQDLSKEVRNTFVGKRYEEPTPEQLEYAYVDTEILPAIYEAQMEKARKYDQEQLIRDFSNLSWITAKWEYDGYPIDTQKWLEIAASAARDRDAVARELEEMLLPQSYRELMGAPQAEQAEVEEDITDDDDQRLGADEDDKAVDVRKDAVVRISQTKLVAELLGKLLGMEVTSLEKTARANLEREYRARHNGEGHPFFQKYALWSKLAKQASTYGRRFLWYIHPLTGRIHPTFNIAGTDTGRYSSTAPNLLNIPAAKEPGDPDFRGAFIAPEGCYLLGADYETMELRIAGDISQDPMVKKMVESGADAHGFTATNMFHIVPDDVAEPKLEQDVYRRGSNEFKIDVWHIPSKWTPEQVADFALSSEGVKAVKAVKERYAKEVTRGDAKSVTFLWLFQGTPFTLAQRTGLSTEHCEDLFRRFADVYKKMDSHMKALAETVHYNFIEGEGGQRYAYSVGYGGIRRYVELPHNPHESEFSSYAAYLMAAKQYRRDLRRAQRELCNLPCQGGNARITCDAILKLVEVGGRYGAYPWLVIYDEMIAVAPDSVEPKYTKILLEQAMLDAADTWMKYVPAGAEADISKAGKYWRKS